MDISPDKQNIDKVFSGTRYYIDFYQRDYRWTGEPVKRLLDDLFYKFTNQYERSKNIEPGHETISAYYPWYYLNTYVTNTIEGREYIVDGQQRFTTLSLVLIKMHHMADDMNSELVGWIDRKIVGQTGFDKVFWMNHMRHTPTQQALFSIKSPKEAPVDTGITAQNMVRNYLTISDRLDIELKDLHQFETFVFYFLKRVVLINLAVEQTDVPMVFEVINDRGVRLRSYEILKGKLLGQIDKLELDQGGYNEMWERQASAINYYREDEFDEFFRFFLKAKFATTRKEGQRFDGDYHRTMFSNDVSEKLCLDHDPAGVKKFLKNEFTYYGDLYKKLRDAAEKRDSQSPEVYYNYRLLNLDAPFLLGLSACRLNDPQEGEKIKTVSREIDRYFSLLQLQNAYDSNDFADSLYTISQYIRGAAPETYRSFFDLELSKAIGQRRNASNADPLSYTAFKQTGINLNMRFKRYFFARIDEFLAENMNENPRHTIADLVTKTGSKTGFHVEHILSNNEENLSLFDDEEQFEQERNRLGGILLLKGRDNISSGNEPFREKLRSYANTLYWNETLRRDTYKSKLDMQDLRNRLNLDLQPMDHFGPEELESRHRLLFQMVKIIWNENGSGGVE